MSIRIPTSEITSQNIDFLERRLYIQQELNNNNRNVYKNNEKIGFFKVIKDYLHVPFYFGVEYFGKKYLPELQKTDFTFHGNLRPKQAEIKDESLDLLRENNTVLLSAYPGFGKTITTLSIISELKLKTLVIVNKLVLIEQWKDAIEKFLNIKAEVIKGKNSKKILNSKIYISNATNIPKHDLENLNIGCVVTDEAHLLLTKAFSEALLTISPSKLISLSATPYRYDNFNILFDLFFGLKRIDCPLKREHLIYQIVSKEKIESEINKNGSLNWASVISHQTKSPIRNQTIVDNCNLFVNENRHTIVLCKRIEQILILKEKLEQIDIIPATFYGDDLDFERERKVLLSTFQKAGTGFDYPDASCLILGVDCENYFLQVLGRIFRKDDIIPIIVDIVDNHQVLLKHWYSRKKVYIEANGIIQRKK